MIQTEPYRIPEGKYDLPYIYALNGNDLTDGADYTNLGVRIINDGDFILRRIAGLPNIAERANIRDSQASLYATGTGVYMPPDKLVLPERIFPVNGQILVDLYNVSRQNNSLEAYFAQMIFQGVLRKNGTVRYPQESKYPWYPTHYTFTQDFTIDWAGTDPTPRHFGVHILDTDFELQRLTCVTKTFTGAVANWATWQELMLTLYDPYPTALMSSPILDQYIFDNQTATLGSATGSVPTYNGVFPVPSVMYPAGSWIKFDIVSLLPNSWLPATYQICFEGVRRYKT